MLSQPVSSNQTGLHESLAAVLDRHLATEFRRPLPAWLESEADHLLEQAGARPLILDSGCGTGFSTLQLARQYPGQFVIGIDQSADRLSRNPAAHAADAPDNFTLLRADLQDIWRILQRRGVTLERHCIFYPNPWPKAHHLMRRWHGHPVWPTLLALGGEMELRTNWDIYANEFAWALTHSGLSDVKTRRIDPEDALAQPVSQFEIKYAGSGHALWKVSCALTATPDKG